MEEEKKRKKSTKTPAGKAAFLERSRARMARKGMKPEKGAPKPEVKPKSGAETDSDIDNWGIATIRRKRKPVVKPKSPSPPRAPSPDPDSDASTRTSEFERTLVTSSESESEEEPRAKRKPPRASLPGTEHKPERRDEKQLALRAIAVKGSDELEANLAHLGELRAGVSRVA